MGCICGVRKVRQGGLAGGQLEAGRRLAGLSWTVLLALVLCLYTTATSALKVLGFFALQPKKIALAARLPLGIARRAEWQARMCVSGSGSLVRFAPHAAVPWLS